MAIDFLRLLETLAETGLEFVIVGGVAARLYGSDRVTHDIDVVPVLEAEGWSKASADGFFEVDLLVGEAKRFAELRARAIEVTVGDHAYRVAHIDDLIAMKRAAGRPQDLLDVETLERIKSRTTS